jgi:hypothetical protein
MASKAKAVETTDTHHPHDNVECKECGLDFDFDLPIDLIKAAHLRDVVIFAGAGISTEVPTAHPATIMAAALERLGRTDITGNARFETVISEPNF